VTAWTVDAHVRDAMRADEMGHGVVGEHDAPDVVGAEVEPDAVTQATMVPSRRAARLIAWTWWRACAALIMCSRRSSTHFTGRFRTMAAIGTR